MVVASSESTRFLLDLRLENAPRGFLTGVVGTFDVGANETSMGDQPGSLLSNTTSGESGGVYILIRSGEGERDIVCKWGFRRFRQKGSVTCACMVC
jgi:hypothetical protein